MCVRMCVRTHISRGGAEREGERESQAASALSVQSLIWGWNSQTSWIMTCAEIKSQTLNRLSHPGCPSFLIKVCKSFCIKRNSLGAPGWQSVKCLTLDFSSGHDHMVCEIKPHMWLCYDSGTCLGFSLSLSVCPSPAHAHMLTPSLSHSLSLAFKINKHLKKET